MSDRERRPAQRCRVTAPGGGEYELDLMPDGTWAIPADEDAWRAFLAHAPVEYLQRALMSLRRDIIELELVLARRQLDNMRAERKINASG